MLGLAFHLKQGQIKEDKSFRLTESRKETKRGGQLDTRGLRLGGGVVGKFLFRIREQHTADHLIPLMRDRAVGAAKLDLVLRCIALSPRHAGPRLPGLVLPGYSWEKLHDLARSADTLGEAPPDIDASREVIRLKRKWVGQQLARLEDRGLVKRFEQPGRRPKLLVLRDDGTGEPFDDPDGSAGNSYITVLGGVIASGHIAQWGTPELSGFLAAMTGERHAAPDGVPRRPGHGKWFRSLAWFADKERRYSSGSRVLLPFSVPTLERGIAKLEDQGLVVRKRILHNPRTGRRLQGPRNLYENRFDTLVDASKTLSPVDFDAEQE